MNRVRDGHAADAIADAADALRRGGLVAFPTETVYGLGADASNAAAVGRIFAAKGRPADHPLIVHLHDAALLGRWASDIPSAADRLADRFWPGPLTLILRRRADVPAVVTGGQSTIGLRIPGHRVALSLLEAFGGGVAAPSANRFGRISPTTAAHVEAELGRSVDRILDGGPCAVGLESTIVDLTGDRARLLRPGAIGADALAAVLGEHPAVVGDGEASPRASGRLPAHYAPLTPMRLIDRGAMGRAIDEAVRDGQPIAVLSIHAKPAETAQVRHWSLPAEPEAYARVMYARLREADAVGCSLILLERPPEAPGWQAVLDRLRRAAAGAGCGPGGS